MNSQGIDISFVPLELWRASSLSTETKQVIAAYERLLAASDFDGLLALRTSIEVSDQTLPYSIEVSPVCRLLENERDN